MLTDAFQMVMVQIVGGEGGGGIIESWYDSEA